MSHVGAFGPRCDRCASRAGSTAMPSSSTLTSELLTERDPAGEVVGY